jgi:hypothetical protein
MAGQEFPVLTKEGRQGEKKGYAKGYKEGYEDGLKARGMMRCDQCQGTGKYVILDQASVPCIECGGYGIVSCCEGSARHGQLPDPDVDRMAGEGGDPR